MMLRPFLSSLALLLTGCAAGVADTSAYPSLARRAAESHDYETPAAVPVAPAPVPDPAADATLARYAEQATKGAQAFDSAYPDAEKRTRAASGAAVSSEAWVAAQTAISGLESARNDSISALAALDTLYTERVNLIAEGKADGPLDVLDAARTSALAAVDSQNDRLDALKAKLAQP